MLGNVGDQLIDFAAEGLLENFHPDYRILQPEDLAPGTLPRNLVRIYVAGGGNLGDRYPGNVTLRSMALATGVPVVILPQSWTGGNEDLSPFNAVWTRERSSQRRVPDSRLGPDLALSLGLARPAAPGRSPSGLFLRSDGEGLFAGRRASLGDPVSLAANIVEYLDIASGFRHICTDRLHFAIAGLLLGKEVTLLPNSYYKNRSMYTTWLKSLGCDWADSPDELFPDRSRRQLAHRPRANALCLRKDETLEASEGWKITGKPGRGNLLRHPGLDLSHVVTPSLAAAMSRLQASGDHSTDPNGALRPAFNVGAIKLLKRGSHRLGGSCGVPLEITVHPPRQIGSSVVSLSDVRIDGAIRPLWFRLEDGDVDEVTRMGDPHLLAMLFPAMLRGQPLWLRGAAVSRGLLENLAELQQIWSLWANKYHAVSIEAEEDGGLGRRTGTLCAFSGGVDSTFSLLRRNLDHGGGRKPIDTVVSVRGLDIPWRQAGNFRERFAHTADVVRHANAAYRALTTNLRDIEQDWEFSHGAATAAALSVLAPAHDRALIPATFHYGILYPWGSTPLTDHLLGSRSLAVASDGADFTRPEKLRWLGLHAGDWLDQLRFCWRNPDRRQNCGRCQKCAVTALMLRLAGEKPGCFESFPSDRWLAGKLADVALSRLDRYELLRVLEELGEGSWRAPGVLTTALKNRLKG